MISFEATEEDKENKDKDPKRVQSLERALNILEVMAQEGAHISVSGLASKVNLKVSTVHRLLTTLMHQGYVEQDTNTSKYRLGLKLLELGNASLYYHDVRSIARPYMEALVDECNETVNLVVLDETEVVYIDQVESKNMVIVKMFAQVGNRGPVYCTASGKCLLAYLPESKLEEILGKIKLVKYTNETIVDTNYLRKELAIIREEGHSFDWGEMEEHVRCVAVPIFDRTGGVVSSISISGPANRIASYYIKNELTEYAKDTANKISRKLGYKKKNEDA